MNSKASNFKKQAGWIIALGVAAIAVILGFSSLFGAGSDAATKKQVWVKVSPDGLTYTAHIKPSTTEVENWRYLFRNDADCEGPLFRDGGRTSEGNYTIRYNSEGNPVYVVYGSNEFRLDDPVVANWGILPSHICFNALLTDGSWTQGGRQLEWGEIAFHDDAPACYEDGTCDNAEDEPGYGDNDGLDEDEAIEEPDPEAHKGDYARVHQARDAIVDRITDQGCASRSDLIDLWRADGIIGGEILSSFQAAAVNPWSLAEMQDYVEYVSGLWVSSSGNSSEIAAARQAIDTPCAD